MKYLVAISALFLSLSAQATSMITFQNEVLPHVYVNDVKTDYTGVVRMDFMKNTIRVEIVDDVCGQLTAAPGQITCLAMARIVVTLEAPLQNRGLSCGSSVYSGERDQTPVDGLFTAIKVLDHKNRLCKDVVAGLVEVQATRFNPWTQTTTNYYLYK